MIRFGFLFYCQSVGWFLLINLNFSVDFVSGFSDRLIFRYFKVSCVIDWFFCCRRQVARFECAVCVGLILIECLSNRLMDIPRMLNLSKCKFIGFPRNLVPLNQILNFVLHKFSLGFEADTKKILLLI